MSASPDSGARPSPGNAPIRYGRFVGYVALALLLVAGLILLWWLAEVVLLAFGAVLAATLLRLIAQPLHRFTPLPYGACLALAGLLVLGLVAWTLFLFGSEVSREFDTLLARVREGAQAVEGHLNHGAVGRAVLGQLHQAGGSVGTEVRGALSKGLTAVEGMLVIVFTAAYLAAQPRLYRDGFVTLIPAAHRQRVAAALDRVGQAVRFWLIGQLIEMVAVGALTALVTWLIGLPSPLALGLIATITEFVPYIGPLAAAVPALLVAVTQGVDVVLWTLGAYAAIHLFEGNVLMPMLQRWLVQVPPALMLLGIAASGLLFGVLGVVLAAPAVVALYTLVRKLYVEDVLGETPLPPGGGGEPGASPGGGGTARGTTGQSRGFARLLLAVHMTVVVLTGIIVADAAAGAHGRLMPWPRGGEVIAAMAALLTACLLAALARGRRCPIRSHEGRNAGSRAARPGRQGPSW